MTKAAHCMLVLTVGALSAAPVARAEGYADKEHGELAKALGAAKVPLEAGLSASAKEGTPISAKFELEDGKLQLSVYTEKNGRFSEVIVDHQTGKVNKVEAITEGEDLSAAKEQSAAMAKAKRSLSEAVAKALAAHGGTQAVSATAALSGGEPVAEVALVKGGAWQTVKEKLD